VNVCVVTVAGSSGWSKLARTVVPLNTSAAEADGANPVVAGFAGGVDAVENVQETPSSGAPSLACTAPLIAAV
jgi:hypothetical protein